MNVIAHGVLIFSHKAYYQRAAMCQQGGKLNEIVSSKDLSTDGFLK
jgi:hypothetical protein